MQKKTAISIDYIGLKKASLILRALNHKLRQQIVKMLDDKSKVTVTEIYQHLKLEQSVASQHLAILRRVGIVKTQREGKFVYYNINQDRLEQIQKVVDQLLK
jgi:DNA-binding transcriptional ArsR family regulator